MKEGKWKANNGDICIMADTELLHEIMTELKAIKKLLSEHSSHCCDSCKALMSHSNIDRFKFVSKRVLSDVELNFIMNRANNSKVFLKNNKTLDFVYLKDWETLDDSELNDTYDVYINKEIVLKNVKLIDYVHNLFLYHRTS